MGALRIRKEGSAGTHNGMRNIVKLLGTENFVRFRVGIKKETPMALIDFVLSQITADDHAILDDVLQNAADGIAEFVNGTDIDVVMQHHNIKK